MSDAIYVPSTVDDLAGLRAQILRQAAPYGGRVVCVDRGVKFIGASPGPQTLYQMSGSGGGGITSVSTVATFGTTYYVPVSSSCVQLVFSNGGPITSGGGLFDSANGFAITIKVGVEAAVAGASSYSSSQITPVTFAGAETYTFPASRMRLIASDPIAVLPAGYYRIRVCVTLGASTDTLPYTSLRQSDTTTGIRDAMAVGDVAWSGAITETTGTYLYGPVAVLGYYDTRQKTSVVIIGDSIGDGSGDGGTRTSGFVRRGLSGNTGGLSTYYNLLQWTRPGAKTQHWVCGQSSNYSFGNLRLACSSMAEVAIVELGTNDLPDGASTVQTRLTQLYGYLRASGIRKIYQTTLMPKTTSTDSWATTANQTVTSDETARLAVNTWILGGAGGLIDGYIDVAAQVTTTTGSGARVWRVDLGTPTTDGIHPTAALHQQAATAVSAIFPSTGILPGL